MGSPCCMSLYSTICPSLLTSLSAVDCAMCESITFSEHLCTSLNLNDVPPTVKRSSLYIYIALYDIRSRSLQYNFTYKNRLEHLPQPFYLLRYFKWPITPALNLQRSFHQVSSKKKSINNNNITHIRHRVSSRRMLPTKTLTKKCAEKQHNPQHDGRCRLNDDTVIVRSATTKPSMAVRKGDTATELDELRQHFLINLYSLEFFSPALWNQKLWEIKFGKRK